MFEISYIKKNLFEYPILSTQHDLNTKLHIFI